MIFVCDCAVNYACVCVFQEDGVGSRRGAVLHESAAHGGSFGLALPGEMSHFHWAENQTPGRKLLQMGASNVTCFVCN